MQSAFPCAEWVSVAYPTAVTVNKLSISADALAVVGIYNTTLSMLIRASVSVVDVPLLAKVMLPVELILPLRILLTTSDTFLG